MFVIVIGVTMKPQQAEYLNHHSLVTVKNFSFCELRSGCGRLTVLEWRFDRNESHEPSILFSLGHFEHSSQFRIPETPGLRVRKGDRRGANEWAGTSGLERRVTKSETNRRLRRLILTAAENNRVRGWILINPGVEKGGPFDPRPLIAAARGPRVTKANRPTAPCDFFLSRLLSCFLSVFPANPAYREFS